MTILLTGAAGFIGSALAQQLDQKGYAVTAPVRNLTQKLPNCIKQISMGDFLPDTDWNSALKDVDTIIHTAARVHVMQDTATDPLTEFRLNNTAVTLNLARQAADAGARRFIFLSSIKVNGESTTSERPFMTTAINSHTEYLIEVQPNQDHYAQSKREAEEGLRNIAAQTGMEVVIIRPPLVYGAGVKGNFQSMMRWLQKGIPLPFGSIHNQRSLVALPNLVDLITICINHPAAANQTFLVSDGENLSTTELLHRLSKALGKKACLLPIPKALIEKGLNMLGKKNITQRLCGNLEIDITHTQNTLNWSPPVSVDAALQQTAQAWLEQKKL